MGSPAAQRAQLDEQRRKVDFDTYDITVDELVRRVERGRIEVAPVYQRQFRWEPERQSRLIESILLGIPVPPLFMATNVDPTRGTRWEVVDGLQRLLSLVNFLAADQVRMGVGISTERLRMRNLEKLHLLNNLSCDEMPEDIRTGLEDRPVKVIVLNDKSDHRVRLDLFERLNTGGIKLTDQEIREAVYVGEFTELLTELASSVEFKTFVRLPSSKERDGTPEEYVLRFFAFLDEYKNFEHSVKGFLDDYCETAARAPRVEERRKIFNDTFSALARIFPSGLITRKGMTPVNLFEGVAVGAALALRERPGAVFSTDTDWVTSEEVRKLTTGATNSRPRVTGRIEHCRDMLLGAR